MGTSIKRSGKIITFLCIAYLSLTLPVNSVHALSTIEDINSLAETVKLTTETFKRQSLEVRMKYEFAGRFTKPEDKENLQKIAKRAGDYLQVIAEKQRKLKKQIEDYEADDWDAKYGASGLWRKLSGNLYTTILSKCEIDFYLALTAEQLQRNDILHKIVAKIDSLGLTCLPAKSQLLKAKTLALLARQESAYKPLAKKEFDKLTERSDMRDSTAFRISIERIKFLGKKPPNQLVKMAESIAKSKCNNDFELILSLAFLQRHLNQSEGFEKTVNLFPQTADLLGSLILSDLSYRFGRGQPTEQDLQQITVFEAELAVQSTWGNEPQNYKLLLSSLADIEKFQTPLILYVTAMAITETSPTEAARLLINASKLQQVQKSDKLQIEADKIAEQAAKLAYNLFAENSAHCQLATEAFENYSAMAGKKIDEELQYLFSVVLNDCGQTEKSTKVLQKIADRPTGSYRKRAKLELLVLAIEKKKYENQDQQSELLDQLSNLIWQCTEQNEQEIRAEAIIIYCQLLLESKEKSSAQKALNILAEAETANDPDLNAFKAKALQQLGRLDESANCLVRVMHLDECKYASETMELLSEIISRIDQLQVQADNFDQMMQNCKTLAQFCYDCLDGQQKQQAGLYLAEVTIFAANKEKEQSLEVDALLNNLSKGGASNETGLLRCRARLFGEQGKFEEAAGLWAKVCEIRKSQTNSVNQRSWQWWRAKFYELDCWAKRPKAQKENIVHTIEVLENSLADIPPLWADKLSSLKQQCCSQQIGQSN